MFMIYYMIKLSAHYPWFSSGIVPYEAILKEIGTTMCWVEMYFFGC